MDINAPNFLFTETALKKKKRLISRPPMEDSVNQKAVFGL